MAKKKAKGVTQVTAPVVDEHYNDSFEIDLNLNKYAVAKVGIEYEGEVDSINQGANYKPKSASVKIHRADLDPEDYEIDYEFAKEYIPKPTAQLSITENGVYNVLNYRSVNVDVAGSGKEVPVTIFIAQAQAPDQAIIINPSDGSTYTTINLKPDEIRDLDTSLIFTEANLADMPTKQEIETRLQNLPEAYEIDYTADPGSVIISYAGYNEYDDDFYTKLSLILMVRRA